MKPRGIWLFTITEIQKYCEKYIEQLEADLFWILLYSTQCDLLWESIFSHPVGMKSQTQSWVN